jgi:haloalkane dehalogenase
MLPTSPDAPGAEAGQRVADALQGDPREKLLLWATDDPILTPQTGAKLAEFLGADAPTPIPDAGHFLQEDQGELIGRHIADWLTA